MQKIMCKKWSNRLKAAETYTHTCNLLLSIKQIGTICFAILISFFSVSSFADNITTSPADCTQPTLSVDTGTANLTAEWEANTIGISWYNDGQKITGDANAATQCTYDHTFSLPTQPTKTGYTFTGWKAVTVPSGYTQLEYLEFSGNQYINTGIVLTDATNIEQGFWVQLDQNSLNTFVTLFGFMASSTTPRYGVNTYQGKWMLGINTTSNSSSSATVTSSVYQLTFVTTQNNQTLKDGNGNTLVSTTLGANALSGNTLPAYFGARNNSGSAVNKVVGKMGPSYLKQNGTILYNFIPVRHNSDDVLGMFDTVSGTFFTNAGSGTFTAGPELNQ